MHNTKQDISPNDMWVETDHPDFLKLLTCVKIFGAVSIIGVVIYFFSHDAKSALSIVGPAFLVLTLYHTPFGLIFLFAFLALENAFVFREDLSYSKLIGIVVLASYVLHIFDFKIVLSAPQRLMIMIAVWSWVSVFWSLDRAISMNVLTTYSLYFGFCFIALGAVRDKKSFYLVLSGFVIGAILVSGILFFGTVTYSSYSQEMIGRARLSDDNSPVITARSIAFGFIIVCCAFFVRNKTLKRAALALLVFFLAAMIAKTGSRMPTITALAAPVLAIILCSEREKRIKRFFIAVLIAVVAYFSVGLILKSGLMSEQGAKRFTEEGLESSGRLRMWAEGLQIIASKPLLGCGLNTSHLARKGRGHGISLHSNYVGLPADLGLIGAALFVALILVLYKQASIIRDAKLKFLAMAMIVYPCMSGITSSTYGKKDFWYALMIVMMCIYLDRTYAPQKAESAQDQKTQSHKKQNVKGLP